MIYQLEAMHDARKSFYGKALVESGVGHPDAVQLRR